MTLIAFGINHKTAPVEIREKVAFSTDVLVDALSSLKDQLSSAASVILSTCNRTELYVHSEQLDCQQLSAWLAGFHQVDANAVAEHSYLYEQEKAVQHLMRVASGLDSMVLGEPQILGQVKQAFTSAKHSGAINSDFDRLFQQTFAVAKKVRSETDIGANAVSVAFAAVQLAKHIFSSLKQSKVLLIGAGETIELVARHLKEQGVEQLTVANRTLARAEELARLIGANSLTLAQVPENLPNADIVISSTASQLPILGKGMVEKALKKRRHKPVFFVDLAVPRDIEPEVAELSDAYLYTVDDLQQIVEQNIQGRRDAADDAEKLVLQQTSVYMSWRQSQASVDLVKAYRQKTEQDKQRLQTRALNQIAEGKDPQEVIAELSNKLTNSLLHPPTQALKQAAQQNNQDMLRLLSRAFELESEQYSDK